MQIRQGMQFKDAGEFYDWYKTNRINMGLVLGDIAFTDGKIVYVNTEDMTVSNREVSRDDFIQRCDEKTLLALGVMSTLYLIGYAQGFATACEVMTESKQVVPIVGTNGKHTLQN